MDTTATPALNRICFLLTLLVILEAARFVYAVGYDYAAYWGYLA